MKRAGNAARTQRLPARNACESKVTRCYAFLYLFFIVSLSPFYLLFIDSLFLVYRRFIHDCYRVTRGRRHFTRQQKKRAHHSGGRVSRFTILYFRTLSTMPYSLASSALM